MQQDQVFKATRQNRRPHRKKKGRIWTKYLEVLSARYKNLIHIKIFIGRMKNASIRNAYQC